jgi:hypothetical protein
MYLMLAHHTVAEMQLTRCDRTDETLPLISMT